MTTSLSYYTYLTKRSQLSLFIRQFFVKDLRRHFTGDVLDVGCGIGEFLQLHPESVGLDLNLYLVNYCHDKGLRCCPGSADSLPFPSDSFNGVLLSNVIEHLIEAEIPVAEAVRVLKPGGTLVITVPMEAGFRYDPTHVRMFRHEDLYELARTHGLQLKTIYPYPLPMAWPGKLLYFCELRAVFEK